MPVEELSTVDDAVLADINRLIPQLSTSTPPLTLGQVQDLIDQPNACLLAYRNDQGAVRGMLTLATFTIPTGLRAWIEDVVVDADERGNGVGRQLVEAAIAKAEQIGARTVDLTSRPSREAANRLYQHSGFELRETNVYRFASK